VTPLEVLDLAFPEPGRTVTDEIQRQMARAQDSWVAQAKPNYLNRMRVKDRMESGETRSLQDMLYEVAAETV
jgi:hypothetical protein